MTDALSIIPTDTYLPVVLNDLLDRGLTLYHDADSTHKSKAKVKWAKDHNLPLILAPNASPDFSIIESEAHPLKRLFHTKHYVSEKAA